MFMGLRLAGGVDLGGIHERHGVDVWDRFGAELEPFVRAGMVRHVPKTRLALTRRGMLVASELMTVFISGAVR